MNLKKIVIIGPESTGKSKLCEQLAVYYNGYWLPEYARTFLEKMGKNYTYENLLDIAMEQINLENNIIKKATKENKIFLFIDTDLYVMKVWCEFVFNKVHPFIINTIDTRKYDLYLLNDIDLPWAKDDLREYPDIKTRKKLFDIYHNYLINQKVPFGIVRGTGIERLKNAIAIIEQYEK